GRRESFPDPEEPLEPLPSEGEIVGGPRQAFRAEPFGERADRGVGSFARPVHLFPERRGTGPGERFAFLEMGGQTPSDLDRERDERSRQYGLEPMPGG